ncbi:unnamed protein product [Ectocarpus sp. 12 AP-2014]
MYPVLKTLIAQLFMPLPITIMLIVIGLISYRFGRHKFGGGVVLSGVIFLLLMSWGPVAERLLAPFEHRYSAVVDWPRNEAIDTVVVLGGGWSPGLDVTLTGQLGESSVARLMEGIRLWNQQPESILIVTGASRHGVDMPVAQGYARAAITLGVPPRQLQVISTPTDTAEEAQAVRETLGEGARVLLVTSASHMPRAMRYFEQAGLAPHAAPTHYLTGHAVSSFEFWVP